MEQGRGLLVNRIHARIWCARDHLETPWVPVHIYPLCRKDFWDMSAKLIAQRALAAGIHDAEQLVAFTMGFMSSKVSKSAKPVKKVIMDRGKVLANSPATLFRPAQCTIQPYRYKKHSDTTINEKQNNNA